MGELGKSALAAKQYYRRLGNLIEVRYFVLAASKINSAVGLVNFALRQPLQQDEQID